MPLNWKPLRPVRQQSEAYRSKSLRVCLLGGRGSGKSEIAKRKLVRSLLMRGGGNYGYALPTYAQAKRVVWKDLCNLIPAEVISRKSESELTIETVYGSTLHLLGMDKAHRAEGIQYRGVVIDEASDQKPGVVSQTFAPALTAYNGWMWVIGVPKSWGCGASEYKQFCLKGFARQDGWETYHWSSSVLLSPEQLRAIGSGMDPKRYGELMDAIWDESGGSAFHSFKEGVNVSTAAELDRMEPVLVGSDFNVNPMAWILAQRHGEWLYVFDEIWLRDTNTQATLDHLWSRYGRTVRMGWKFYGDATGKARRTSASTSDYVQIVMDHRFDEYQTKQVYYPRSNPAISDRLASCNARLNNRFGEPKVLIHPRCVNLIADLKARGYKPGTKELDDSGDIGHITDAFGYVVHALWPMTRVEIPTEQLVVETT